MDISKQEKLNKTEESLRLIGCIKCSICNFWVGKDFIIKDSICNLCFEKQRILK